MKREEAIERIKTRFDKWALDDEDMKAIQILIPELSESENERIRKALIKALGLLSTEWLKLCGGAPKEEMLAYLEKQKEQKPAEWSEEDEQYLLVCKNALNKYQRSDHWDANIISKWLENRLKSFRPQPKQEWSEEEKGILLECISALQNSSHWLLADKLSSLLPQPHCKPSEEQMKALEYIINSHTLDAYHLGQVQRIYQNLKKMM